MAESGVIAHQEGEGGAVGCSRAQINDALGPSGRGWVGAKDPRAAPIGVGLDVCPCATEVIPKDQVVRFADNGGNRLLRCACGGAERGGGGIAEVQTSRCCGVEDAATVHRGGATRCRDCCRHGAAKSRIESGIAGSTGRP